MHKAWHWGVGDGIDDYVPRSPPSGDSDSEAEIPPSWAGKAPHLTLKENTKSKKWDADWWRSRLCGTTTRTRPRIPYGKVYELMCMDGLWQGRMLVGLRFLFLSCNR